jgi:hypothetical protein
MKLLTHAFASYTDADCDDGFCPPEFTLVHLGSAQAREDLLRLRDLATTVAEAQPTFGPKPKDGWFDYLVYEVNGEFAIFFNDRQRSVVGPYLDTTATHEEVITPPLMSGRDHCRVPDNFSVPEAEDKFGCATMGDDGPVRRYTDTKLMACAEGFWFTHGVECYSAKLITGVILWSVLEEIAPRGC